MKNNSKSHAAVIRRGARISSAVALGLAATMAFAACSSGSSASGSTSTSAAEYGDIDIQLSYLKNTEFAGEYLAIDNGYFTKAGFGTVTLTAGGSSATSAEAQVATGKSLLGISSPLIAGPAVAKGAAIKIVAADYQKNPFDVVSTTANPINTPADLKGKTIAVADFNSLVWQAFLKANGLTTSDLTVVPYTDGPSQLASGQVDGYLGYTTGFTGTVGTKSEPAQEFLLADAGLPLVSEVVLASQDNIDNHPDKIEAALTAIVEGWNDAIADPAAAAKTDVEKYGKDQNYSYKAQLAAITKQKTLMVTDDTKANGLLTITPTLIDQSIASLKLAGIDLTSAQLFDTSLINKVYEDNPGLK